MMRTKQVTLLTLTGCLFCMVVCQELQGSGQELQGSGQTPQTPNTVEEEDEDNDPNSALARLTSITNVDEFLSLLTDANGNNVSHAALFSGYDSESGKTTIRGGGRMAEPDDCSPRNMTVVLNMPTSDPNTLFFPQCTRIERCGGCCSSRHLNCVPSYTERVSLKVIRAKAPFPGSSHLHYNGFASVIVERHLRCKVECQLSADKCGPKKRFLTHQCDCKCRDNKRCDAPHIWSPETCDCECIDGDQQCCDEGTRCRMSWNKRTCRCDLATNRQYISNTNNMTQAQIDAYYRDNNMSNPNGAQSMHDPIPTTTISTTSTTTGPTTTVNPCATVVCPNNFRHHVVNGTCTCRPNRRIQRPRRPRGRRPRPTRSIRN